jgi:hypothetical protein
LARLLVYLMHRPGLQCPLLILKICTNDLCQPLKG